MSRRRHRFPFCCLSFGAEREVGVQLWSTASAEGDWLLFRRIFFKNGRRIGRLGLSVGKRTLIQDLLLLNLIHLLSLGVCLIQLRLLLLLLLSTLSSKSLEAGCDEGATLLLVLLLLLLLLGLLLC